MNHPTYPLQKELTEEITRLLESPDCSQDQILKTRAHFLMRRNAEFPGWREKYEKELKEWLRIGVFLVEKAHEVETRAKGKL